MPLASRLKSLFRSPYPDFITYQCASCEVEFDDRHGACPDCGADLQPVDTHQYLYWSLIE